VTSANTTRAPPQLIGGALCVDFANTVHWRGRPDAPDDHLRTYADLVQWCWQAGAISDSRRRQLLRGGAQRPEVAARVVHEAVELRETLVRLLLGRDAERDLEKLNRLLGRAPPRVRVSRTGDGFEWVRSGGESLEDPLWPILWDGVDLLTSEGRDPVRVCGDVECGWLFLDASRGHRRRWCSMETCGNRAKARRHYARQRRAH
jgi:predicted RNA-binding Zn ribbon-like protein